MGIFCTGPDVRKSIYRAWGLCKTGGNGYNNSEFSPPGSVPKMLSGQLKRGEEYQRIEPVALVMELNEDERERMLAERRWRWQMDQAALRQDSYDDGKRETEAKYQPLLEETRAIKRAIEEKDRAIEEKNRENQELKRRLQEAGLES